MRPLALLAAFLAGSAAAAYDANGIALGSSEAMVTKTFADAVCQPLQWTSRAAERRCDGKASVGGVSGRITFYLKADRVQAFDLRFDPAEAERFAGYLKKRYGPPASESRDKVQRLQWEQRGERAVLTAQAEKRRAFFTVSRGDFEEQIYRLR